MKVKLIYNSAIFNSTLFFSNWILFIFISILFTTNLSSQNNALHFDGINDYITGPNDASFELESGTIELWIKPETAPNSQTFICYRDNTGFQTRYLWNFLGNLSGLGFWNGTGFATIGHSFTAGQWYHLAFVDDESFGTIVYVDGISIGVFGQDFGTASGPDLHLVIGNDIPGTEYFNGEIDEVRIWNHPLAAEDILDQKDCNLSGTEDCLIAYYKFDEGTAGGSNSAETTLTDESSNNFDCALINFALTGNTSNWITSSIPVSGSCAANSELCVIVPPSYTIQAHYLVTSNYSFVQEEYDVVVELMDEVQAWYQVNTGGKTFELETPGSAIIVDLPNSSSYYNVDYWGRILSDLGDLGYTTFDPTKINIYFIKGGGGVALGAQACGGDCGVCMVGMDLFPEFNTEEFFTCPEGTGVAAWPCTPKGAATHELGHCFGLPHPADAPPTNPVANHSVMQTHWNYPYTHAPAAESPWGLLSLERQTLFANPFFISDISLTQPFEEIPLVNLPNVGSLPTAGFTYTIDDLEVAFTNTSSDNPMNYWTFGDGSVSGDLDPVHSFDDYDAYIVRLRVTNSIGMMDWIEVNITLTDPLPVDLVSFKGRKSDNHTLLDWTTASEISFSHFVVEKSVDTKNWKNIGVIDGKGNAHSIINDYSFLDVDVSNGTYYYRLKIVDYDETFEYSNIVTINFNSAYSPITIYPIPTESKLNITGVENTVYEVLILDLMGQIIQSYAYTTSEIDVSSLASGIYFISFINQNERIVKKFIVKK